MAVSQRNYLKSRSDVCPNRAIVALDPNGKVIQEFPLPDVGLSTQLGFGRVATAFEHRRNADRQPAGHYGKLRDWQIAEAEDDEAALSLFCLATAGAAATRPVSA